MSGADAAIVGTGPNGLAAAVTLARAGLKVALYEAGDSIGGGLRSAPLFDSEIVHDLCSAVHPLVPVSPFFRTFDLPAHGVRLRAPDVSYAHPLGRDDAAIAWRDLETTAAGLGPDGPAWRRLMEPLIAHSQPVADLFLSSQRGLPRTLAAPLIVASRLARHGTRLARRQFTGERAAALLAGVAAHAVGELPSMAGAAVALALGHLAHTTGWPLPEGGSDAIAHALAADITAHGGIFHTGVRIRDLRELEPTRVVLADLSPRELLRVADARLPRRYASALATFRYGPAAAKTDFLLSEPVPWVVPELRRAGTIHLGGTRDEIVRQERSNARGLRSDRPFVLVVQPTVADPGRARPGRYPLWAYAHVPHGATEDAEDQIIARISEHAPGFRDTIIARRSLSPVQLEQYNPNYVGGDIGAGAMTLRQAFLRPAPRWNPYRTPLPGVYLCSASTPPGPGVHGMCGYLAARSALRREFGLGGRTDTPVSLSHPG